MNKRRSRSGPSFGVLFWIACILLVVVLYLASHETIRNVLDETNFVEVVFEDRDPEAEEPADPRVVQDAPSGQQPTGERAPDTDEHDRERTGDADAEAEADEPERDEEPLHTDEPDATPTVVVEAPPERGDEPPRSISASLYFIRVSDDGRILTEAVTRDVRYTSSPLSRSIDALIGGPTTDDINHGLLSLVPPGTVLESAWIEDGVAYLDFNEQFRFNPMGLEGYLAQLKQVVLTATDFPTVDRVQILVERERIDYLGGDGVYIGAPLAAADLPV